MKAHYVQGLLTSKKLNESTEFWGRRQKMKSGGEYFRERNGQSLASKWLVWAPENFGCQFTFSGAPEGKDISCPISDWRCLWLPTLCFHIFLGRWRWTKKWTRSLSCLENCEKNREIIQLFSDWLKMQTGNDSISLWRKDNELSDKERITTID